MFHKIENCIKSIFDFVIGEKTEEGWMFKDDNAMSEVLTGKVIEILPNKFFRVKHNAEKGSKYHLCHFSGRMRRKLGNKSICVGNIVKYEVSPYDLNRGRIVNVLKKGAK